MHHINPALAIFGFVWLAFAGLAISGLHDGWISLLGGPLSRYEHPVVFWAIILLFACISTGAGAYAFFYL